MLRTAAFLAAFAAALAAPAQDKGNLKKGADCCKDGKPLPWNGYNKGIRWTQDMEAAFESAREQGRLLMVHNLVGDMDRGGC